MKTVDRWRWRIHHYGTGEVYTSRHHMTEADALAVDPLAVRVEWTRQAITLPDPDEVPLGSGFRVDRWP